MITGSLFWFVVFAGLGGVVVFVGLLMEKLWDKKWHSNMSDFRRSKIVRKIGEWVVIGGIMVEIVVAVFVAKFDWENEPLNRPIREISANVWFEVKGDDFKEVENPNIPFAAFILPYVTNEVAGGIFPGNLMAEKYFVGYSTKSPTSDRLYSAHFSVEMLFVPMPEMSPANEINKIKKLEIGVKFLPKGVEILKGGAVLVANGNVQRYFSIPWQNVDKTNLFFVIATNSSLPKIWPSPFELHNVSNRQ